MAITAYCKKCARDVPPGDTCSHCGAKLSKSSLRVAWCVDHVPVRDWMSWNAAMRLLLPLTGAILLIVLLLEALAGGTAAVEALLRGGLVFTLLMLLSVIALFLLLVFILQGEDVQDCSVDGAGVHIQTYLINPTPMKLLLRLRSPSLMAQLDPEDPAPLVLINRQELAWRDVTRVQLWPEKGLVLLYAPAWWMRLAIPCTALTWEDVMTFLTDKLGRKKNVALPRELIVPPKPKATRAQKAAPPPPATPMSADGAEKTEDFVPLADVLEEIRRQEEKQ